MDQWISPPLGAPRLKQLTILEEIFQILLQNVGVLLGLPNQDKLMALNLFLIETGWCVVTPCHARCEGSILPGLLCLSLGTSLWGRDGHPCWIHKSSAWQRDQVVWPVSTEYQDLETWLQTATHTVLLFVRVRVYTSASVPCSEALRCL